MSEKRFRFIDLGARDGYFIQAVYEAVAYYVGRGVRPPTIISIYPSNPYVCIGVNQLPDMEVDIEFCRSRNIDVVRRQVGGGAVYLDQYQHFYHIIVPRDHPLTQGTIEDFFRRILQAIVCFYRSYNLNAEYKPINDVVINGRKASGNGAALLHNSMVLIGNVILDFNADIASQILRVPDEKLKAHLVSSMKEWMTSLKRELGYIPPRTEVVKRLKDCFSRTLEIELEDDILTKDELSLANEIANRMRSDRWLYALSEGRDYILQRYDPKTRVIKIREGHYIIYISYRGYRTYKGVFEIMDRNITNAIISTDSFTITPKEIEELCRCLTNKNLEESFYRDCIDYIGNEQDRNDIKNLVIRLLEQIQNIVY